MQRLFLFESPEICNNFIKFKCGKCFCVMCKCKTKRFDSFDMLEVILNCNKYKNTSTCPFPALVWLHHFLSPGNFNSSSQSLSFPHVTKYESGPLLQPSVIALCSTHFPICFNWERHVIELIFQGINQLVSINVSKFIAWICLRLLWGMCGGVYFISGVKASVRWELIQQQRSTIADSFKMCDICWWMCEVSYLIL